VRSTGRPDRVLLGLAALLAALLWAVPGGAQESSAGWRPVTSAFHVHSRLSLGSGSLDTLAAEAQASGIEAIFLTDNFLLRYEYGQFPLRGLIRRAVEFPSVMRGGIDQYLAQVREAGLRHPGVMFIPGVEVVPHYYWTGSVFKKNLTMHDSQKNILVLGLKSADEYRRLPMTGNEEAYEYGWMTAVLVSPVLLVLPAIWLIRRPVQKNVRVGWTMMSVRVSRVRPGVILLATACVLLINNYPFASPSYDPYRGGSGHRPHQDLIRYVRDRGGLTIWSMPEAKDFNRFDYGRLGVVTVKTDPYPEALRLTSGYTGFGSLYEDTITVTDPGGLWDGLLLDYMQGRRADPPWGLGEVAYHGGDTTGKRLHQVETVFWVKERTPAALLEAAAKGRMYAVSRTKEYGLRLDDFSLVSEETGDVVASGQTLQAVASTPIRLRLSVSFTDGQARPTPVQVVRSGHVMAAVTETTPFRLEFPGAVPAAGGGTYYRVMIGSGTHRIVSNPIFVRARRDDGAKGE
jgi:hypothetical protein